MPELPEIETVKNQLANKIIGKEIKDITVRLPRLLINCTQKQLQKKLKTQTILQIIRRGKYLIFLCSSDGFIFHLGMTGQLTIWNLNDKINNDFRNSITGIPIPKSRHEVDKHTHITFSLSSSYILLFRDIRTFGKFIYIPKNNWLIHPRIIKLGPEPLGISVTDFLKQFPIHRKQAIKTVLLDQSFLAGVGNIYADESLFVSKINPKTPCCQVTIEQQKNLRRAVIQVLKKGIKNAGTTFSNYRDALGEKGGNQESLWVYGRNGKLCLVCESVLKKVTLNQRTSVFCGKCQGGV